MHFYGTQVKGRDTTTNSMGQRDFISGVKESSLRRWRYKILWTDGRLI